MLEERLKIKEYISGHKQSASQFLSRLVQEDSTRGQESKAQAVIIERCRALGLKMDIWELSAADLSAHSAYCSDRNDYAGNPIAVGVWNGAGGGRSLILNGHIDVVPPGEHSAWKDDPFSGKIENGRLYGRGATDMKGGTASLLLALEALIHSGIRLKGDVIFQSVIEEESGGAGTLAAVLRGYEADGAIIPEPTSMKFFPKQQGSLWFRVIVKGKQAHGGTRYEGVNAIEKAFLMIQAIRELEAERNKAVDDPLYKAIPIPIPINVGKISSGDWPSSVPDLAVIEGRMGVGPDEDMDQAKQEFRDALQRAAEKDGWLKEHVPEIQWFGASWLPGNLDPDHELVLSLGEAFESVTGQGPVIEASPWATDGGILNKVGGVPVVIFGPGETKKAHETNEYIELEKVYTAAEIIAVFMMDWCGLDKEGQ